MNASHALKRRKVTHGTEKFAHAIEKAVVQLGTLKQAALKPGIMEDKFSLRLKLLGISKSIVNICCTLLPYASDEEPLFNECRTQLQGHFLSSIDEKIRLNKAEYAQELILEMESIDHLEASLGPFFEGSHGALKEVAEQTASSVEQPLKHRHVVVDACAALCTLASECLGEVGSDCNELANALCGVGEVLDGWGSSSSSSCSGT